MNELLEVYENAVATMTKLVGEKEWVFGGGVWVYDARDPRPEEVWRLFRLHWCVDPNVAHLLDPLKVDTLRQDAESLFDAYPSTEKHLIDAGCTHTTLLHAEITSTAGIQSWAYSIFNAVTASRPLAPFEQYPFSVVSTAALVPDNFQVIHPDLQGYVAVCPAEKHSTVVYWTPPGTDYHGRIGTTLGPRHPVSRSAWAGQVSGSELDIAYAGPTTPEVLEEQNS